MKMSKFHIFQDFSGKTLSPASNETDTEIDVASERSNVTEPLANFNPEDALVTGSAENHVMLAALGKKG